MRAKLWMSIDDGEVIEVGNLSMSNADVRKMLREGDAENFVLTLVEIFAQRIRLDRGEDQVRVY